MSQQANRFSDEILPATSLVVCSFNYKEASGHRLKWLRNIFVVGFITVCCGLAFYVRCQNLSLLDGQYLLGTDSYRFLHQAEYIAKNGELPERDMTRWLPLGRDLSTHLNLSSYCIVTLYRALLLFSPSATVYQAAVYYPVILHLLILMMSYLLVCRILNRGVALLTVAMMVALPSMLSRSMAGFADRDGLCLLLILLSFYCYIRGLTTHSCSDIRSVKQRGLIWSFISGIVMMLLGLTWEGAGLFIVVIVLLHLMRLILSKYTWQDWIRYMTFISPILIGLFYLTKAYRGDANYSSPFASLALGVPVSIGIVYCFRAF